MRGYRAHIGSYTESLPHVHGQGIGIYTVELCPKTGQLVKLPHCAEIRNASYLCKDPTSSRLYASSEIYDYQGGTDGSLSSFDSDLDTGALSSRQTTSSCGSGPAYISLDQTANWLLCANYIEGNFAVFPISTDGLMGEATENIRLEGCGPVLERQEGPHPHAILTSPNNRFVYAVDLGADCIRAFEFNSECGKLRQRSDLDLNVAPGSGPRHFVFHPSSQWAYIVNELSNEVIVCDFDSKTGKLSVSQNHSTLPIKSELKSHCSELCLTSNGQHLYVANRGHDSIAMFEVCQESGRLKVLGHHSCGGHIPRHIALSPKDEYLLVANQESSSLTCFRRDPVNGLLGEECSRLTLPTPAYIEFMI